MEGFNQYGDHFAKVYDEFWKDFVIDKAEDLFQLISDKLQPIQVHNILDLCCGTGRLLNKLSDINTKHHDGKLQLIGLDLSSSMLELAKLRLNAKDDERSKVKLIQGDATDFELDEPIQAVISTFDSINHLNGLEAVSSCFISVYRSLEKGGIFLFDMNTSKGLKSWNFVDLDEADDRSIIFITQGKYKGSGEKAFSRVIGFIRDDETQLYHRFDEVMFNNIFNISDITNLLERIGFNIIKFYSEDDLKKVYVGDPEKLDRIFILAKK